MLKNYIIFKNGCSIKFPRYISIAQIYKFRRCFSTEKQDVRVRFAPSPTGFLHLGGLRTLLYNHLFATSQGGALLLRLEDTDRARLVPGAADALYDFIEWAGIRVDEGPQQGGGCGPYVQSERTHLYREHADRLLQTGAAYRCFCSPLRLEMLRKRASSSGLPFRYDRECFEMDEARVQELVGKGAPHTVRLLMPAQQPSVNDLIYGEVSAPPLPPSDPVLLKSCGGATYHLANVVDDHSMGVTHVLRGMEWLTSTPLHLQLYKSFGWSPPRFAHLPLIVNADGSKLSKRQNHASVQHLQEAGYSPLTLFNWIVQSGVKGKDQNEVYSLDSLAQNFSLGLVRPVHASVDLARLEILGRRSLQLRLEERPLPTARELGALVVRGGGEQPSDAYCLRILREFGHRSDTLLGLAERGYLWAPPTLRPITAMEVSMLRIALNSLNEEAEKSSNSENQGEKSSLQESSESLKRLKASAKANGFPLAKFMKLLRLTLTGKEVGEPVGELMSVLGRGEVMRRLGRSVEGEE